LSFGFGRIVSYAVELPSGEHGVAMGNGVEEESVNEKGVL